MYEYKKNILFLYEKQNLNDIVEVLIIKKYQSLGRRRMVVGLRGEKEYPQRALLLGTYVLRHRNMLPLIFKVYCFLKLFVSFYTL